MSLINTKFGNASINSYGYYRIVSKKEGNRGKLLHRLIYEDYFKVTLLPFVDIHHINKNKKDNNINNLKPMYHNEHCRKHKIGKNNVRYGTKHTVYSKQKMSDAHKGKKVSKETKQKMSENHWDCKGEKNPMYGKHHSSETRQKMSENHSDFNGKNNPNYRSDIDDMTILNMYNNGLSKLKISKIMGCSPFLINSRLKKMNIF